MDKLKETDLDQLSAPIEKIIKPLKKEAKKPPILHYYDVKVECLLPAVITYKILAEDAYKAAEMIKGKAPNTVSHKLYGRKELMLRVYDSGSNMMRFMKRLLG